MSWAMVFPGQGSQSVGMLQAYDALPEVRETMEEASDCLNQDFMSLVAQGPEEDLNATIHTQPIMLAAGVGVFRAWCARRSERPQWLAGHSLGEYTALVAAGSLDFKTALQLTRFRAMVMQEAVPAGVGGMAAILGLANDDVVLACQEAAQGEVVEAVNFNSPGQVVIAGHRNAVARALETAHARGAKRTILLPLSVPSHCSLMKPAAERLAQYLHNVTFVAPTIPVIHNADVRQAQTPAAMKEALVAQLFRPVRWVETVQQMARMGCTRVVECGPGKVLAPLVRRIDTSLEGLSLSKGDAVTQIML